MLAEAGSKLPDDRISAGPGEAGAANAAAAAAPAAVPANRGSDAAPVEPEGSSAAAQPAGHDAPHAKGMRRCGGRGCSNRKECCMQHYMGSALNYLATWPGTRLDPFS